MYGQPKTECLQPQIADKGVKRPHKEESQIYALIKRVLHQ